MQEGGKKIVFQQTSLTAYHLIKDSGSLGKRQRQVYETIQTNGPITNCEISRHLGLAINVITPRTNKLVQFGLVEEKDRRKCNITWRTAIAWGVR